ncbi:MAG: response regulator transcription factor [Rudanella sp.]|nr:response regulator transcription factor [Rudanella sp.]
MYLEKSYRYIVIEDDETDQLLLQEQLASFANLQLAGSVANPLAALPILESESIDLLFMDVFLPLMNGLDFLESLPNPPQTIIITASDAYAVRSYELGVADYLTKPFTQERLEKAVQRVLSRFPTALTPIKPNYVVLKAGWESVRIPIESINYVEAFGAFCKVHTTEGMTVVSDFLATVYAKLPPHLFLRIHKSFVVASWKVQHMGSRHVLVGQAQVPVGASYRQTVEQTLLSEQ